MTDSLFFAVAEYGTWIVAMATFLSCLALPIPASFVMLAGGALSASGDLSLPLVTGAAWTGAVLGDQTGFVLGRRASDILHRLTRNSDKRQRMIEKTRRFLHRWGLMAVFLSRWLFSPFGPYVNVLGGAGRMSWHGFTLGSFSGEAVWAVLYVSLGYTFAEEIYYVADLASDAVGLLASLAAAALLGVAWLRTHRPKRNSRA